MKKILLFIVFISYSSIWAQEANLFSVTLNHNAISVKDVNRSVMFYKTVLHLEEITNRTEKEGIRWMSLGEGKELHLISLLKEPVTINKAIHFALTTTNFDAFVKTFPDRYQSYLANNTSSKDIASYVTAYNKNKLVNLILEQSLIPSWILNQDLYQKAINVQAELMMSANSEKVRSDAANSLLTHLKPPEVQKVELDIGVKKDGVMDDLKNVLTELALKQQQYIAAGITQISDVTQQRLVRVVEHDSSPT